MAASVVECFQPCASTTGSRIDSPCLEQMRPRRTIPPLFADGGEIPSSKDDSSSSKGEITDLDKAFSEITQEPIKKTPEPASNDGPKIDIFSM